MKYYALLCIATTLTLTGAATANESVPSEKPRVIVSTDIGGSDPDDFQSMVHYLVYADRFDTEGLISSPPHEGRVTHILEALRAYEKDFPNLRTWSSAYPTPDALRAVTLQGATEVQAGDLPDGTVNDGARHLIERAHAKDSRPLYVLAWGSMTDVAIAVHADPTIKKTIRIYSIGSWNTKQDKKSRDYLVKHHPDLWWIECDTTFRGMYMGGVQDGEWGNLGFTEANVTGHGALGALFMAQKADIKMSDTACVYYLLHGDPDTPESAHWGGAFIRPDPEKRPTYWHDNPDPALAVKDKWGAVTVNRWRKDFLEDWKHRMDRAQHPKE